MCDSIDVVITDMYGNTPFDTKINLRFVLTESVGNYYFNIPSIKIAIPSIFIYKG